MLCVARFIVQLPTHFTNLNVLSFQINNKLNPLFDQFVCKYQAWKSNMAKYVQISKDIINIREVTDPNKSEEDGCELVHGKQSSSDALDTDTYRNI